MPTAQPHVTPHSTRRPPIAAPLRGRAGGNQVVESAGRSACARAGGSDSGIRKGPCSRCSGFSRYFRRDLQRATRFSGSPKPAPRIPDRPLPIAMLADRVPALPAGRRGRLAFASVAMDAIGRGNSYTRRPLPRGLRRASHAAGKTRLLRHCWARAARTVADADRNFRRYMDAIRAMERRGERARGSLARTPRSFREALLHSPSFDAASYAQVRGELLVPEAVLRPRRRSGIGLTIDAEGSESLSLQLDLFAALGPIRRRSLEG